MYKVVDHILCIYGHFFQDCPSSFYGQHLLLCWGRFNTFFVFQGSRMVFQFGLQEDQQWIVVCISTGCCSMHVSAGGVVWSIALPISNQKGRTCFCGLFMFCCHSILTVLQHLQEEYQGCTEIQQQPTQIILASPSTSPSFEISSGIIVKIYDCWLAFPVVLRHS